MRSADTDPAAERVHIDLLRKASPARRAALARSLSRTVIQLSRRAIRDANPTADADEIAVRCVALWYGQALADGLRRDLNARRHRSA